MDNIQLYYIDNEINKIDKMKQGDVIYKNGVELLVVLSYDHNEPCKGCFFYEDKACVSERLIKCWDCKDEYSIMRIDNLRYIPINTVEDYYKNELDPNEAIYVDGPVAHYNVEDNYYSLAKHKNIQIKIRNIIEPDGEFENLVERLFNEAKKNLL